MKTTFHPRSGRRHRAGFSLLELLVAVGLLSVLVLALYAMFDQTQKALHANIAQTDVMEGGRTTLDLLSKEVERAHPTGVTGPTNNPVYNVVVRKRPLTPGVGPGSRDVIHRDATFSELFYMLPVRDRVWSAAGLYVANETDATQPVPVVEGLEGLGTLYRYQAPTNVFVRGPGATTSLARLFTDFDDSRNSARLVRAQNSSRILDGIVFFRVLPFGGNGMPLDVTTVPPTTVLPNINIARPYLGSFLTSFTGTSMPSALEVEFGVLPPKSLIQYRSVPDKLKAGYLAKHAAEILLFRQRIALRSALP